ncbi:glucan biosynthesis protein [Gallaecimonas xiamenensis]|uniref:Glucans biosynthesis protein G n=1 Tax=Gallaecimonas xiamenensis 3-C-1 TaxID=745411 RepID=K2JTC8_9GAMM|nr:Glucans biosynthesis protein G precursor [Gallaecimonas xiamenensis 3-C-1]
MKPYLMMGLLLLPLGLAQAATPVASYTQDGTFSRDTVVELARQLSKKPFKAPEKPLPEVLDDISYDQYRDIRFSPSAAIWANSGLPYQMQFFLRGLYFKDPVEVAVVEDGKARHLAYDPAMFSTGAVMNQPLPAQDIGFSGFRLHAPINKADYYDEVAVFQGASYFRSLGRNQNYGLSARGLAVKTADPQGEEFPAFRAFWVEKPSKESNSILVYALLDSPSTTGAYRFTIRPGDNTIMDVEATLFPRVDLDKIGLAPATSMYMFSMNGRQGADDYRPQVHDSDGLLILNGKGERLWRPLANPASLQISAFEDTAPMGFGLMQRERNFDRYQDLEAHYENRPSLWVEPVGNWGKGAVTLVEIPSQSEIHDNIVSYWDPAELLKAGSEYSFAYRLSWGTEPLSRSVRVAASRAGRADIKGPTPDRLFVVDYQDTQPPSGQLPQAQATTSAGTISDVVVQPNPSVQGYRVSFRLHTDDSPLAELRLELKFQDGRQAETWLYRWTPDA